MYENSHLISNNQKSNQIYSRWYFEKKKPPRTNMFYENVQLCDIKYN